MDIHALKLRAKEGIEDTPDFVWQLVALLALTFLLSPDRQAAANKLAEALGHPATVSCTSVTVDGHTLRTLVHVTADSGVTDPNGAKLEAGDLIRTGQCEDLEIVRKQYRLGLGIHCTVVGTDPAARSLDLSCVARIEPVDPAPVPAHS